MSRPALEMVCGVTEGNQSDVADPLQKSLVTNTREPRYLEMAKIVNSRN